MATWPEGDRMEITFFMYNKKPNSTAQPTATTLNSATFDCNLLDATSVINPVVVIERDDLTRPFVWDFTYAYIRAFGRYYFVVNIVSEKNLWVFHLSVDVLATYRTDIRNSSQYVLRSASESDENIVDKLYITKPYTTAGRSAVSSYDSGYVMRHIGTISEPMDGQVFYFNYDGRVASYAVCFGIVGSNGVGANYYVATEDDFITFMTNVFALVPSDMGSLSDGLKKTLLDLNQYIISVVRLPVMPHTNNLGVHKTSVKLGSYTINCDCYSVTPGLNYEEYWLVNDLPLPQHPKVSTHAYFKMPPFTSYSLDFLPLGSIPLDAAKLYGVSSINVLWRIDYISGMAWFKIGYFSGINFITLATDIAQVGIPIPLSQLKVDNNAAIGLSVANVISDAFTKIAEKSSILNSPEPNPTVNRTTTGGVRVWRAEERKSLPSSVNPINNAIGNFFDPNTNILDQIIDYAGSILGDVVTKGSTGTYLNIVGGVPEVRGFFIDQAENDNVHNGSPLYKVKTLSTLSGFCICQNAMVNFSSKIPLSAEAQGIINMLNRGIYLE